MTVAEMLLPYSVSVSQAVLTMAGDNDSIPVGLIRGVTWKRAMDTVFVGNVPCQTIAWTVWL